MDISLDGWDIGRFDEVDWVPWGSGNLARAKILAQGDGYYFSYVEAKAGYTGDPHEHGFAEFSIVLAGTVRNQGKEMTKGDAYIAAPGSIHADFEALTDATYVNIFKL